MLLLSAELQRIRNTLRLITTDKVIRMVTGTYDALIFGICNRALLQPASTDVYFSVTLLVHFYQGPLKRFPV